MADKKYPFDGKDEFEELLGHSSIVGDSVNHLLLAIIFFEVLSIPNVLEWPQICGSCRVAVLADRSWSIGRPQYFFS